MANPRESRALASVDPPVGTILAFAGVFNDNLGDKWMLCRGQSLLQSDYQKLYIAIGDAWGKGDNPGTTFNLPDLRGQFLRGVAMGVNSDPDRERRYAKNGGNAGDKVGSYQDSQFETHKHPADMEESGGHTHRVDIQRSSMSGSNGTRDCDGGDEKFNSDPGLGSISASIPENTGKHTHTVRTYEPNTGHYGMETRPTNAYVHYVIRVK